jgi:hypothetical protein
MGSISPTMELTFEAVGVGGGGDRRAYVGNRTTSDGMAAAGWEEQPQRQVEHAWEVADEATYRAPLEALLPEDSAWLPEPAGYPAGSGVVSYVEDEPAPGAMTQVGWEEQPQWLAEHAQEVADEAAYRAPLEALLPDEGAWRPESAGYPAGSGVVSYVEDEPAPGAMTQVGWEEQPQWQAEHAREVADEASYRAPPEASLLDRGPWPVEPAGSATGPPTRNGTAPTPSQGPPATLTTPPQPGLPSLDILTDQVASERETINSHSESLDIKAGLVLGFAGVLVGLGATAQPAVSGRLVFQFGLAFAVVAALVAALCFLPRWFPVLQVARLRQSHLAAPTQETKRELLDAEIAMVEQSARLVKQKGLGLRVSAACLAIAAAQVVIGTLMASGGHSHHG